ncbi:TRAM domain-containing protein [Bdellovibrionota bacterium FG-2]
MNETITLEISDLSRGGAGVSRDATGRVVFVPFTAPGDTVSARIISAEKRYAQGELIEVLKPSPQRLTPRCPAFGKCGGCEWQHLSYDLQWKTKTAGVKHALARVQVDSAQIPFDELPAEQIWEYRNRIQLRGFRDTLGFYARGTHDVVSLQRCDIARAEINAAWDEAKTEGAKLKRPYKLELEVAPASEGGQVSKTWNAGHSARGFRQVHDAQNVKLKEWVESQVTPGQPLLDLFGGSGNLSLELAANSSEVHCVDVQTYVGDCPGNFHSHSNNVLDWLKTEVHGLALRFSGKRWSAILDPPRIGLGQDFSAIQGALKALGVSEVILAGCDPDSWARDVSRFVRAGWKVNRLGALDFFPQTPHVESLAKLIAL